MRAMAVLLVLVAVGLFDPLSPTLASCYANVVADPTTPPPRA